MSYQAKLKLEGIVCGGCFNRINQLMYQADLLRSNFDYGEKTVEITYDREKAYYQQVILKIQAIGYNAKLLVLEEE